MGLVSKFRERHIELKSNPILGRQVQVPGIRGPVWMSATYASLAREGYIQNADVYACVNLIGQAFGGIRWGVWRKKKKSGFAEEIHDHALETLLQNPNPWMSQSDFLFNVIAYRELSGNSFIYRSGMDGKPPLELWPMRPDRTMIVSSGDQRQPITEYQYTGNSILHFVPDKQGHVVVHWKTFHPLDDWWGLSPVQAASRNVDQSNAAQEWNVSLLQNSARPPGALSTNGEEELSDEQRKELRNELDRLYSGAPNAGRPLLLEGGMQWVQMSHTPAEMDWLEGDERARERICSVFNVPGELIGVRAKGGLNDANFKQARLQFYMENILPKCDSFRGKFNTTITPLFREEGIYIDYDPNDIEAIQEDRSAIFDRAITGLSKGLFTLNQALKLVGMPAENGGDIRYLPTTIVAVSMEGDKPVAVYAPLSTAPGAPGSTPQLTAPRNNNGPAAKPGQKMIQGPQEVALDTMLIEMRRVMKLLPEGDSNGR